MFNAPGTSAAVRAGEAKPPPSPAAARQRLDSTGSRLSSKEGPAGGASCSAAPPPDAPARPHIIVVSSRLPVCLNAEQGPPYDVELNARSGNLLSAVRGLAEDEGFGEIVWVGWPGASVPEDEEGRYVEKLREKSGDIRCVPVWLSLVEVEHFFEGFCNSSLWPLLHWMTPYAHFKSDWAECYRKVNQLFAEAVVRIAQPGDVVWVQDFHLLLLPQMIRERCTAALLEEAEGGGHSPGTAGTAGAPARGYPRAASVGSSPVSPAAGFSAPHAVVAGALQVCLFLHTPFPSYEVMCVHPQCAQLLEGALGADLIGFQTYSYLRHFRSAVLRVCGYATELDRVDHRGHRTKLGVFPSGANAQGLLAAMRTPAFSEYLAQYTELYQGQSIVLSVEHLDYAKGLPQKLAAIRCYLEGAEKDRKAAEDARRRKEAKKDSFDRSDEDAEREAASSASAAGGDEQQMAERVGSRSELVAEFARMREEKLKKSNRRERGMPWHAALFRMGASWAKAMTQARCPAADQLAVFVLLVVPPRQDVPHSKDLGKQVHNTITEINGRFSTPTHQPIVYIHRAIELPELAALYARADCCLVTPLVAGMNHVAKEFLVVKDRTIQRVVPGVVVISELAGAAQDLFDALAVNPHNEGAVVEAIAFSLDLSADERWEFTEAMRRDVLASDSVVWGRRVLSALLAPEAAPLAQIGAEELPDMEALRFRKDQPGRKALFLDYDGTLREIEAKPEDAVMSSAAKAIIEALNNRDDLKVFVVSGRDRAFLDAQFAGLGAVTLVGEHGYHIRRPDEKWQHFNQHVVTNWKAKVVPVMELFVRSTPGSFIEQDTGSAVVWHYRECDERYGEFKAKELVHLLSQSLGNLPCQISRGHKIVEVASLQVSKGAVLQALCAECEQAAGGNPFAAMLCVGDDRTDESMFVDALLMQSCEVITVKVGTAQETHARFCVPDPAAVRRFLQLIVSDTPIAEKARPAPADLQDCPSPTEAERQRGLRVAFADHVAKPARADCMQQPPCGSFESFTSTAGPGPASPEPAEDEIIPPSRLPSATSIRTFCSAVDEAADVEDELPTSPRRHWTM